MDPEKKKQKIEASVAPGMDDGEELNEDASESEVQKGDFTEVTTLSYDEVDPS
jgi:hypothetical protein